MVVHGHDGLDEISVCAPTRVTELAEGMIRTYDLHPQQFFGDLAAPDDLKGGDPQTNADITRAVLNGERGPCRNVVVLNAAAALVAAGRATDLGEGIPMAETALDSGAARQKLEALIAYTTENS